MIGAIVLHIQRKDGAEAIATILFIIALDVFVAYSRSGLVIIVSRLLKFLNIMDPSSRNGLYINNMD